LIVHKNVLVDGKVVNVPSFVVTVDLEDKLSLKERKVKAKKEEPVVSSGDDSGEPDEVEEEKTEEVAPSVPLEGKE